MNPAFALKMARLQVVPRPDGSYHVTDPKPGSGIYTVRIVDGAAFCTCIASTNGARCTHKYAVRHFVKQQQKVTA